MFSFCSTTQKKTEITRTEKQTEIFKATENDYKTKERETGEVFRVFSSSDHYEISQLTAENKIKNHEDIAGNESFSNELKKFDKIDWSSSAKIKLELYPDTGGISRIRFERSSGIGELDKLISDDITRWIFKFPGDVIEPRIFNITYYIVLQNAVTRKQALEELQKHVR